MKYCTQYYLALRNTSWQNNEGLSPADKKKVKARIEVFDFSTFPGKMASSITTMYGSYVGCDFKLWAQIAVFILMDIVTEEELQVWRNLSEV